LFVDLSLRSNNDFDESDDDSDADDNIGEESDPEYSDFTYRDRGVEELDEIAMQQAAFGGDDVYF
jgi:hypothetical protein